VRTVASGRSLLDPEAASRVMRRMRDQAERADPLAGLTGQERKILELIGEGLTNRQIGERMYLPEKTVKNYVSALFTKLGMISPAPTRSLARRSPSAMTRSPFCRARPATPASPGSGTKPRRPGMTDRERDPARSRLPGRPAQRVLAAG
jgi:DNA-binding CsgD family transcriptional regulator